MQSVDVRREVYAGGMQRAVCDVLQQNVHVCVDVQRGLSRELRLPVSVSHVHSGQVRELKAWSLNPKNNFR